MATKKDHKETKEVKKKAPAAKKAAAKPKKEAVKKEAKPKKKIEKHVESKESAAPRIILPVIEKAEKVEKVELVAEKKPEIKQHHHVEVKQTFKKSPAKVKYDHATGGRKTSDARVWLSSGSGKYLINGKPMKDYACGRRMLTAMAMEPFVLTSTVGKFDVKAYAIGGGIVSQIGAVRQAVSKAISLANPDLRTVLRRAGLLTRDPRVKERKKYGQKRARKRFQFSKR
jgi:small subunit ribosomal protein S9